MARQSLLMQVIPSVSSDNNNTGNRHTVLPRLRTIIFGSHTHTNIYPLWHWKHQQATTKRRPPKRLHQPYRTLSNGQHLKNQKQLRYPKHKLSIRDRGFRTSLLVSRNLVIHWIISKCDLLE